MYYNIEHIYEPNTFSLMATAPSNVRGLRFQRFPKPYLGYTFFFFTEMLESIYKNNISSQLHHNKQKMWTRRKHVKRYIFFLLLQK